MGERTLAIAQDPTSHLIATVMASPTCQICLEAVDSNVILEKLCGNKCSAQICRQCLGRHIDVTLQQFFPGVLPRVRCPVCLVAMHASSWQDYLPDDVFMNLVARYAELSSQACTMTTPCCHKTWYSHLPNINLQHAPANPLKLLPSQLVKFKTLCGKFCRHKLPPRAVLDFAFNTFGDEKATILLNELTLPRVIDAERRATLLLSLMYLRPNTKTNCCGVDFCFNCKRLGHHPNLCPVEFNDATDLVRCRNCRMLLLKVEGCDAVTCVCGFNMSWGAELQLRIARKKNMLPVDIFDVPLLECWFSFRQQLPSLLVEMRAKWFDGQIARAKSILRAVMSAFIWRKRFSKALVQSMQSEFYWKAYYRWHPQEVEVVSDELSVFLSIDLCE